MHIVRLEIENIKRIKAVTITPTGEIVEIKGKNHNGKTSVLDSIWWALAGAGVSQPVPIRTGEESASIKLSLGSITVHRIFRKTKDGSTTTKLRVFAADGAEYKSPQSMLDRLLDHLAFDPMAFASAKPTEQFDMLKGFVKGVDFGKMAVDRALDFSKRTELNRKRDEAKAAADAIVIADGVPAEPVDVADLLGKVKSATEHNKDVEERKGNRERAVENIKHVRADAVDSTAKLERQREAIAEQVRNDQVSIEQAYENDLKSACDRREQKLKSSMATAEQALTNINRYAEDISSQLAKAADTEAKIAAAGDLPPLIDVSELLAQVSAAGETNKLVSMHKTKADHLKRYEEAAAAAQALSDAIAARDAHKAEKIASAAFPVAGLGLGDGLVLYEGVPFEQASGAQQIEVSLAIAMAGNPELKVVRIKHGNDLDLEALAIVTKMASEKGFQVWMEKVADENDGVGFYIEDGQIAGAEGSDNTGGGEGTAVTVEINDSGVGGGAAGEGS